MGPNSFSIIFSHNHVSIILKVAEENDVSPEVVFRMPHFRKHLSLTQLHLGHNTDTKPFVITVPSPPGKQQTLNPNVAAKNMAKLPRI